MDFHSIDYLEWADLGDLPGDRHRLAASGMPDVAGEEVQDLLREAGTDAADQVRAERTFREAVAATRGIDPANVLPVAGTSMALYLAVAAMTREGDEVLVETPTYEPLRRVPEALGLAMRRFPRRASSRFAIDPVELESLLTPRTRLVAFANHHNPSGTLLSGATLDTLLDLGRRRRISCLVDEVYLDFAPDARSAAALAPGFVTVSSLTKVYGLSCLRAGWITGDPEILRRARRLLSYFIGSHPAPTLAAGRVALARRESYLARARERASAGLARTRAALAGHPALEWIEPDGTLFAAPRVRIPGFRASSFAARLRAETGTVVVPGSFFEDEAHIRVGFGGDPGSLGSGLEALAAALDRELAATGSPL